MQLGKVELTDMIRAGLVQRGLTAPRVMVESEDGVHFRAVIEAEEFAGMPLLARHRMVYEALGEHMGDAVHALSIEARAPA